jgi:hypothetical protein
MKFLDRIDKTFMINKKSACLERMLSSDDPYDIAERPGVQWQRGKGILASATPLLLE